MSDIIFRYFPDLTDVQKEQIISLKPIYDKWNSMINVISRKDMDNFFVHHVLHSLSIARVITFLPSTTVLDVGTGGGFPGIPLAIIFPESKFTLLDSIGKKLKVVTAVCEELEIKNVTVAHRRAEEERLKYHFIVSRAVTEFSAFVKITSKNIDKSGNNKLDNGIIYLKGGDLKEELEPFKNKVKVWDIPQFFDEPFFETKKIVYLPG